MICLIATLIAQPGKANEVLAELQTLVAHTIQEEGNVQYVLHQDPQDEHLFVFYEQFRDQAAFDAHAQQPYIAAFSAKAKALLVKPGELRFLKPIL
jgi:quinol monooxygenase YgiN